MSTVKENSLNKEMAQTAVMFLRLVVEQFTGDSKLIQIQDLILQISNIYGLQTALDGKIAEVAGSTGKIPTFNADGQLDASSHLIGTFTTQLELDALTANGFYTHTGATLTIPMVGDVLFAQIGNTRRMLFGTNGLWWQSFSTAWSLPRYVGGAFDSIVVTYEQAVDLLEDDGLLSPGASYKITGTGQNDGLILRAASANQFETDGILFAIVPEHLIGTYNTYIWKGHWHEDIDPASIVEDHHYIYCGRVWRALNTGVLGTASNWSLDATNWLLMDPLTTIGDFYTHRWHRCSYKIFSSMPLLYPTGFIFSRWDEQGNTLSEIVEDADGFTSDMNDWHLNIDGGEFYGNILRRIYNNTIASTNKFVGNSGNGDIYDTRGSNIFECVLPDDTNNIRHVINSSISRCVLGGTADIQYIAADSIISSCIINGDLKGDASAYCYFAVNNCTIGHSGEIKDNATCVIADSEINGLIDGNTTVSIEKSKMDAGSTIVGNTVARLNQTHLWSTAHITSSNHGVYDYSYSVINNNHTGETLIDTTIIREDLIPLVDNLHPLGSITRMFAALFAMVVNTFNIKTDTTTPTDLTITTGTGKTLVLAYTVWDDIIISANNLRAGATPPTFADFNEGIYGIKFDNGATNIVYGAFEIPHGYKEGTDLYPHIHWSPSSTNTGDCVFNLQWAIAGVNEVFGATSDEIFIQAGSGTALMHQLSSMENPISGAGLKIGDICVFALSRPTGDAFTGDAWLHSFGIHYQIDTLGSRQISTK